MIDKEPEISMDKICRSCMSENEDMRNMFQSEELPEGQTLQLSEMLMACASVQVASGDGLPFLLCVPCMEKLNSAFQFKQQCEKTDVALRKLKGKNSLDENVKEESIGLVVQPDVEMSEAYENYYDSDSEGESSNKKFNVFTCNYCHKVLRTKKGLKIHQRRHTGEKLRSCHICQTQFTRTNHLVRHMRTHSRERDGNHVCSECGASFKKAFHLLKHKKEHKPDDEVKIEVLETNVKVESSQNNENGVSGEVNVESTSNETEQKCDGPFYQCKVCKKVMTTTVGLKIHMRRHTGHNLAICEYCEKSFTKTSHLKRHMQIHGIMHYKQPVSQNEKTEKEKEKKVMQCEFCDRQFKYKKSFTHHMQTEHGMSDDSDADVPLSAYISATQDEEPSKTEASAKDLEGTGAEGKMIITAQPDNVNQENEDDIDDDIPDDINLLLPKTNRKLHICHVCECQFARANHLTRHMTLHKNVLIYKCDRCEKAFAAVDFLNKHMQEDHIDKPYVCTMCDKSFSRGEHLIRHLKVHDNKNDSEKNENLKCSICDKLFTRSDHLARHTKIHLQQDKRHVCSECGKAFNRLDNLKTHQRIHTGLKDNSKLHLCIYCGKEFNNSSNMIVHMRRHTGERPYKCGECGKGFPRSHDLKCHERTHSGEKPYLCTLCGKSFNKSNKLLRHTRVHTGERPYVCNLCGRAFTQSNDLALHMRRHTGSRPYACGMCPSRFIQSGQLKAHRRQTGHWVELPPELKGGHRVEPVTPLTNPVPIKFKIHGKPKKVEVEEDAQHPPKILNQPVGIMGNVNMQAENNMQVQPFVMEDGKILEFHNVVGYGSNEQRIQETSHTLRSEVDGNDKRNNGEDVKEITIEAPTFQNKIEISYSVSSETPANYSRVDNFRSYENYE